MRKNKKQWTLWLGNGMGVDMVSGFTPNWRQRKAAKLLLGFEWRLK